QEPVDLCRDVKMIGDAMLKLLLDRLINRRARPNPHRRLSPCRRTMRHGFVDRSKNIFDTAAFHRALPFLRSRVRIHERKYAAYSLPVHQMTDRPCIMFDDLRRLCSRYLYVIVFRKKFMAKTGTGQPYERLLNPVGVTQDSRKLQPPFEPV